MLALKTGMTWPQIQERQPGEAERDEETNVLPRDQRGRGLDFGWEDTDSRLWDSNTVRELVSDAVSNKLTVLFFSFFLIVSIGS